MVIYEDKIQEHLAAAGPVDNGFDLDTYLDYAENTLTSLLNMGMQKENGSITDPFNAMGVTYTGRKLELFYYHAEARLCGALGQLIRNGRMTGYADRLFLSYNHLMNILAYDFEPELYSEFWVKELVFAYEGLKSIDYPKLSRDIWEKVTWRRYGFHYFNNFYNAVAYALASEACMIKAGLGGSTDFFDAWVPILFDNFDEDSGMFKDPGSPMAYDLITKQQIMYAIMMGADGENKGKALELCERGAVSSLYMQSVTGQMPFGGRTNQFLCIEAVLACFFEMMCRYKMSTGAQKEAGVFKQGAHNAVMSMEPWLKMEPFRHIRQGFHPDRGHGIDSGGVYTVYGLLASSVLGTAYDQAAENKGIGCYETPADRGGYIFTTPKDFHKIFASCGGYHMEIDSAADLDKDGIGLGRLHKKGIYPETALSGSFSPDPTYSYAFPEIEPVACAIGPAWVGIYDEVISLAGCCRDIEEPEINIMYEGEEELAFSLKYRICDLHIEETFQLSEDGLLYSVKGNPQGLHITVPVLKTDGIEKSDIQKLDNGFSVTYRGAVYTVECEKYEITSELCVNRNGIYRIARIMDHVIRLRLENQTK